MLCLPACLCVSTAASRGQAPHRNASLRGRPPWRPSRVPASVPGCCRPRPCPSRALALSLLCVPHRAPRCPCSAPLRCRWPLRLAPALALAQACPLRSSLGTPPVASRPPLRAPVAGTLPRLPPPPLPDDAPGACCRRSCGSVTPGGIRTGAGGQTGRGLTSGKAALGG